MDTGPSVEPNWFTYEPVLVSLHYTSAATQANWAKSMGHAFGRGFSEGQIRGRIRKLSTENGLIPRNNRNTILPKQWTYHEKKFMLENRRATSPGGVPRSYSALADTLNTRFPERRILGRPFTEEAVVLAIQQLYFKLPKTDTKKYENWSADEKQAVKDCFKEDLALAQVVEKVRIRLEVVHNGDPSVELNEEAIFLGLAQMDLEADAEERATAATILTQMQAEPPATQ